MASTTLIGNLALQKLGVSKQIANLETENSPEARALRLAFDQARDFVLRDFAWDSATKYVELGLVDGSPDSPANGEWIYAYRYPSDCLNALRLVTDLGRQPGRPIPFSIGRDDQGRLIFTDQTDAVLKYTVRVTDSEEFDPMFVSMLSWRLAVMTAPALSRSAEVLQMCLAGYEFEKQKAQAGAANEGEEDMPLEAECIRER